MGEPTETFYVDREYLERLCANDDYAGVYEYCMARGVDNLALMEIFPEALPAYFTGEDIILERGSKAELHEALAKLTPKQREMFEKYSAFLAANEKRCLNVGDVFADTEAKKRRLEETMRYDPERFKGGPGVTENQRKARVGHVYKNTVEAAEAFFRRHLRLRHREA